VGSSFRSVNIGPHLQKIVNKASPNLKTPKLDLFIKPEDILFPLKAGDELFIDAPDAKPIPHMQFRFNIVLNEVDIIEGEPLIETMSSMINEVEVLVPKFKSLII
jgi:hypothetical protein